MAAAKKKAEAVSSESVVPASDGAHDLRPLEEQTWAAVNLEYRTLSDAEKPHSTTVAEVQVLPEDR